MDRTLQLLRDAVGAAPRERVLIDLACAVLCIAGGGLLGAAVYHALADAAGPQVARLVLGATALALAGGMWAFGTIRMRRRSRRAAAARAALMAQAEPSTLLRGGLAGPAAAFVLAFLSGRKG